MERGRGDPVARALTLVVSAVYYATWVLVGLLLIGIPLARLVSGALPLPAYRMLVPVRAPGLDVDLVSQWDGLGQIGLEGVRGNIRLPLEVLPTWLVVAWWVQAAVFGAVMLVLLRSLRAVFQRVRDGVPFDAPNALRLRWVGILLLVFSLGASLYEYGMAAAIVRSLPGDPTRLYAVWNVPWAVLFIALAVMALAEVFRRGAALEEEQSLVV